MIGQVLGGFELDRLIGRGGMAEVYRARDLSVDRYVAVKVLNKELTHDDEFRARFDREAETVANLEHLHILPLYTYDEQDEVLYLVMRYMPEGSLADVTRKGPLDLGEAARMTRQMAAALDYAHAHGVLHRDLKPANILLDSDRNAYLTDFGLAKWVGSRSKITGEFVVGTPYYMSPEQCRADPLTPAADQYSLAVVLYVMVTGEVPFTGEKPLHVMRKQILEEPPPPGERRPDLPAEAEAVMLRGLAKEPSQRFPSCTAMAVAFEKAIEGWTRSKFDQSSIPKRLRNRIHDALSGLDDE